MQNKSENLAHILGYQIWAVTVSKVFLVYLLIRVYLVGWITSIWISHSIKMGPTRGSVFGMTSAGLSCEARFQLPTRPD